MYISVLIFEDFEDYEAYWMLCDDITNAKLMCSIKGILDISRDFQYQANKIIECQSAEVTAMLQIAEGVQKKEYMNDEE